MEIDEIKYGFKLLSIKHLEEVKSDLYEFEHLKSGGHLLWMSNDDRNCCFAIAFKTLPEDSTGICHIIEHSTLCGSDRFPLKEPFVNLLKSSLNNFLNAFTASDWTMYPFASTAPKDFENVLAVYLDAVFNPLSVKDIKPFLQEGWHLELMNKDDMPSYKGVVYNEMKGAMSSVNEVLSAATKNAYFDENSPYHHNSGGDPEHIIDLTYEQYKSFYKKHYTPQNAMTYFYGNLDIEKYLKYVDDYYFSHYEKTNNVISIPKAKKVINNNASVEYEIGASEEEKDNAYISLAYHLCDANDLETLTAMNTILEVVAGNNDSPLKKAILGAKLGQNLISYVDDNTNEPYLYIALQKTNPKQKEAFKAKFEEEVKKIVSEGINKKGLLAALNSAEFSLLENDSGQAPKGLLYALRLVNSFNYGYAYESQFDNINLFKSLKDKINSDYFEKLLERVILHSQHNVEVVAIPNKKLGEQKQIQMATKMEAIKKAMSEEEIEKLVKQTEDLIAYQNHVDTKEELATLPPLRLSDIPKEIEYLDSKKCKVNGVKAIYHDAFTNNIAYLSLFFNFKTVKFEDIPYVYLLTSLLKRVPTKNYSVNDLETEIKTYLGFMGISAITYPKNPDDVAPYVTVSCGALLPNVSHIARLINEIVLHSKFTKKETMLNIKQIRNSFKKGIVNNGREIAIKEVRSSFSKDATLSKYLSNSQEMIAFFDKLCEEKDFNVIASKLKEVSKLIFNKKNLLVSFSGDENGRAALKDVIKNLKFPRKGYDEVLEVSLEPIKKNALVVPSGVSYSALAVSFLKNGYQYNGSLNVVNHILNYDYLWPEVRVKGGAYGCFVSASRFVGDIIFSSYRDPNVKNTYEVYKNAVNYLKNFKVSKNQFTSYIIGACAAFDTPCSIASLIRKADTDFLFGNSKKDLLLRKKEIIHTTIEDINKAGEMLKNLLNGQVSEFTVGNKEKIAEYDFAKVNELK